MAAAIHGDSPRPSSRACDRCRRRKIKCDSSDLSPVCINCRAAGEQCTFKLPVSRRGPKAKRRQLAAEAQSDSFQTPIPITPSLQETSRNRPSSRGLYRDAARPQNLGLWASEVVTSALSPVTVQTIATPLSHAASTGSTISSLQRWGSLARELQVLQPTVVLEDLINRCFKLFFEYLFPLIPLVHEPSLRNGLEFFVARDDSRIFGGASRGTRNDDFLSYSGLWPDTTFTLITAVCAETAFLLPKEIFPEGETIAEIFLEASRSCLFTYLEADLEHPNVNSVAIRYFHSNCMHAAGKPRFSWHIFGEATRLAQALQMHDEESIQRLDPLEAEFRRRVFWIIYIGDKSAAILNSRPITIHKFSFEAGITVGYPTGFEDDEDHLASSGNTNASDLIAPKSFMAGFNANLRLWQTASDLLLEIRLVISRKSAISAIGSHHSLTAEERLRLDHLYVLFVTSLDNLPPFLQEDQLRSHTKSTIDDMNSLSRTYTIQAANLHISLHCLKMVITQKFEEINYFPMGDNEMLLLRKTEIARNMLRSVREAPFWALQVNGEPCVEKIRLIGARLLEIIDQHETSPLSARAQTDLSVLLDILTRLDSKASDTLRRSL